MDKEKIIKLLKEEDEQHFNIEEVDEKDLPLVSVIMPVYNAEKTLVDSLRSILTQKYKKIEVLCVNDGSTGFIPWKCWNRLPVLMTG